MFGSENLLKPKHLQVAMCEENVVVFKGKGYIILDFGREYVGMLRLVTYRVKNDAFCTKIRVRFGESVTECCAELGEKNLVDHHSVHGGYYNIPNLSDQCVGDTGFRFVRIDILEDCEVSFKSIVAVWKHCGLSRRGKFESNDPLLNRIFSVALDTVYLTMQNNVLWDGAKRDRLVWGGDLNPEIKAVLCGYGNVECIRNSLDIIEKSAPLPSWINGIPSYSMWWIINLYDYYMYSGDKEYLTVHIGYMEGILSQFESCIKEDGAFAFEKVSAFCDMPYFLDWPTYGSGYEKEGVIALLIVALRCAEFLLHQIRRPCELCAKILRRIKVSKRYINYPKSVLAMRSWANISCGKEEKIKLMESGAVGISSFMSYYILKAVAQTGMYDEAVSMAKEYFGGMLGRGATTFWEDFDPEWMKNSGRIDAFPEQGQKDIHGDFGRFCYTGFRHSLCHGWSSGVAAFLMEYIAGIRIRDCGCKGLTVNPHLCGLQELTAVYPTEFGDLELHCKVKKDGENEISLTKPEGIKIFIGEDNGL